MTIVYIDHPFSHHGIRSGYKQLANYNSPEIIEFSNLDSSILNLLPEKYLNRYLRLNSNWYSRKSLQIELVISKRLVFHKGSIYHFLYGENSFRHTGKINHLAGCRNRILATYHQIPIFFEQRRSQFKYLNSLDAVILVASNQVGFFSTIMAANKIHVIPHGVDTAFFRPSDRVKERDKKKTILTVGSNYRDIDLHISLISAINSYKMNNDLEFQVIGEPRFQEVYSGFDNVRYIYGISDDELLKYYQNADIFLMPLLDTTANNGVLEAMACGIPIVVTDVGGIRDYLDESCAIFLPPHDLESMIQEVESLIFDPEKSKALGQAARKKAVNRFSWEVIAAQTQELYDQLI